MMAEDHKSTWNEEEVVIPLCPACERPTEHVTRPYQPYCVVCRRGSLVDGEESETDPRS
jgi:hypothetical protein